MSTHYGLEDELIYETTLIHLGLVEPDQPLPAHSELQRRGRLAKLRLEFTPVERQEIRLALGLLETP